MGVIRIIARLKARIIAVPKLLLSILANAKGFMTPSRTLFLAESFFEITKGIVALWGASYVVSLANEVAMRGKDIALGIMSFALYLICLVILLILKK